MAFHRRSGALVEPENGRRMRAFLGCNPENPWGSPPFDTGFLGEPGRQPKKRRAET